MREKALAASDASLDAKSRAAYNEDFKALRDQMETVVQNAEFAGVNLINGTTNGVFPLTAADGSTDISVYDYPMQFGGTHSWIPSTQEINTVADANTAISNIDAAMDGQEIILSAFASWIKMMERTRDLSFVSSDLTTKGLGSLVDADMARESARLQAVQVKQQLGAQTLSIANQSPRIALSLFGG